MFIYYFCNLFFKNKSKAMVYSFYPLALLADHKIFLQGDVRYLLNCMYVLWVLFSFTGSPIGIHGIKWFLLTLEICKRSQYKLRIFVEG